MSKAAWQAPRNYRARGSHARPRVCCFAWAGLNPSWRPGLVVDSLVVHWREGHMHCRLGVIIAAGLVPGAVFAATSDIPTRYSGSFPSGGLSTNLRGTFTGSSLTLRYTVKLPSGTFNATGNYSCVNKPPSATRCDGTRTTDGGQTSRSGISIKWKGGKPTWAHIDKPTPL